MTEKERYEHIERIMEGCHKTLFWATMAALAVMGMGFSQ
jgi:hypothetical protein